MLDNLVADLKHWLRKPYDDNMNLLDWVLFIVLWVTVTILWSRVIKRLVD